MTDYKFPKELQENIELDIVSGDLITGSTVSVAELQKRYQTDSEDLDRVIKSSIRKGLLDRSMAENSFTVLGKSQPTIISVFQHAAKTGMAPRSIVRAVTVLSASEFVAQKLAINAGDPVFQQTRTRMVNDESIANQNNYIPIEVCPGLESVDLSHTSFQTVLEGQFNAVVADIKETFEISPASAEDAEILGMAQGSDVLIVQRLSLSPGGLPLVWADIHVRPDRYHYVKDLWPEAAVFFEQRKGIL
jgi:GntR family transcriptional regulator